MTKIIQVSLKVASPLGHEPSEEMVARARALAVSGVEISIGNDPAEAVRGADAVYTDVWASMGQEAEAAERRKAFQPFQVNGKLFALAGPKAIFLHCLPAHRGDEVVDEVADHRGAGSSTRRRTGCTPSRRCSCSWQGERPHSPALR